jgi:hypothetical protein
VLGFDLATGKLLWKVDVSQGGFPERNHPKNTEATSTVASDGERLFATFFHHQKVELFCLGFDGKPLWRKVAGPFDPQRYEYGYAPSPLIYRDLVIVAGEYDGDSFLAAFDRKTGVEKWRQARPSNITFSSPVVAHAAGRDQLLLSGSNAVSSFDPATGKPLWSAPGTTAATCGTMVWDGDIVVASGGYPKAETIAFKADGSGRELVEEQPEMLRTVAHRLERLRLRTDRRRRDVLLGSGDRPGNVEAATARAGQFVAGAGRRPDLLDERARHHLCLPSQSREVRTAGREPVGRRGIRQPGVERFAVVAPRGRSGAARIGRSISIVWREKMILPRSRRLGTSPKPAERRCNQPPE